MGGKTVVLGLSGGVDSAVAARLLQEQGYTVYGHWLDIGLGGREDAQQVAETFGIPFSAGDIRRELEASVMGPFQRDYLAGRTPLPCARCNPTVKFPALFRRAGEVGADWVATGHYARIAAGPAGEPLLCRGAHTNDQAYMLARLPQHWLSRLVFPIGGYEKTQVRQLARDFGLPVAEKPDSMEICFIPDGDYAARCRFRIRRRAILWTGPAGCWAGTGASIAIPSVSAGGWVSRRPTGCLSRRSARRPRRWSSPTARTLWRTRSGGRTLTRWPL